MPSTPTASFDFQNFYSETLSGDITAGTLTIPLSAAPTPDEGILVIDPDADNPEVIYYTSKGASSVTCPADGRGWDSTSAGSHLQGTTVIMAPVGYMFRMMKTGSLYDSYATGWVTLGAAPATVTYNGNRSYSLVVSGNDLTDTASVGMRLKLPRTVTAPTYMGGTFNGSSQYFVKATPSGTLGTITNNFTIAAHVEPTAYGTGWVAARFDSSGNNGFGLKMESDGRFTIAVVSGGGANYRQISTYPSVPLNKKTHVVMTWTSGTVTAYFDGTPVAVGAASTGGTAPTTAGTGGDFAIGRKGASNAEYFTGYIAGVGIFDAVLSDATVKTLSGQALSGSETNNIGAWNLNNAATDSNGAGNNLTATGSVGYTARSPYTNSVTGTSITAGTTNYGIITAITFSTNTTITVQVPEGETLPTSGGIGTMFYSTFSTPYGFPSDSGKWRIEAHYRARTTKSSPASGTPYSIGSEGITIPVGAWKVGYGMQIYLKQGSGSYAILFTDLTTSSATYDNGIFAVQSNYVLTVTEAGARSQIYNVPLSLSAKTQYYLNAKADFAGTTDKLEFLNSQAPGIIYAECAYL